jgi:hypothetical protein
LVDQVGKAGGGMNRSTHGPTLWLGKEDVCPHVAGTSAANLGWALPIHVCPGHLPVRWVRTERYRTPATSDN